MVVERHSEWSPTTKPYDTTWFAEPPLFGEASGYNYAAIYDYLGQYYQMSRLLESDKIDDQTLDQVRRAGDQNPHRRATAKAEAEAVARFVEQGGGLLLIGDHTNFEGSATAMNDITRPMGFIFRDDMLFGFNESPDDESYERPLVPHPSVQHVPRVRLGRLVLDRSGPQPRPGGDHQHRPVGAWAPSITTTTSCPFPALPGNALRRVRPGLGGPARAGPGHRLHRLDDLLELLRVSAGQGRNDARHGRMAQPRQSAAGSAPWLLLGLPLAIGFGCCGIGTPLGRRWAAAAGQHRVGQ